MTSGLTARQRVVKRAFDIVVACVGILVTWPLMVVAALAARAETGEPGIYRQTRIGRHGEPFKLLKIRTMRSDPTIITTVTVDGDPRITRWGRVFRRTKIDELLQLLNVLRGDMSIVGPRPDIPGFHDRLKGPDRVILSVRPGITGLAALRFADEERVLATQAHPEDYSRTVLFPRKVALDRQYVQQFSLSSDLYIIIATLGRLAQLPPGRQRADAGFGAS